MPKCFKGAKSFSPNERPYYVIGGHYPSSMEGMVNDCRTMVNKALVDDSEVYPSPDFLKEVIDFAMSGKKGLVDMKLSEQRPFKAYKPTFSQ